MLTMPWTKYIVLFVTVVWVAESLKLTTRPTPRRRLEGDCGSVLMMAGTKRKHNDGSIGNSNGDTNSNGNGNTKTKEYISNGVDVLESFAALEDSHHPNSVHSLILGTLPSNKSYGHKLSQKEIQLRGGSGPQNYGHSRNSFWNIAGSALGFARHATPFDDQVRTMTNRGYAVWDVLSQAKRTGSLDANLVKGSLVPTDLPKFVVDHPNLNRFVFAANSAEVFCKPDVWGKWLVQQEAVTMTTTMTMTMTTTSANLCTVRTKFWMKGRALNPETFARTNAIFGKQKFEVEIVDDPSLSQSYSNICEMIVTEDSNEDYCDNQQQQQQQHRRLIELIVMPSTSPANARMRPPEKEKIWHSACYRLKEPPEHYVCPGCEHHRTATAEAQSERHWFQDCPYRENWKSFKKQQTAKTTVDPFNWYS